MDVSDHILPRDFCQARIGKHVWEDQGTPSQIMTAFRLYLVDKVGELFEDSVSKVREAGLVGLSGEGGLLGRATPLAWLMFCTREEVFMFDVRCSDSRR